MIDIASLKDYTDPALWQRTYDAGSPAYMQTQNPWMRQAEGTGGLYRPGEAPLGFEGYKKKKPAEEQKSGATGQKEYTPGEETMGEGDEFQYPSQWDTASDWLTNFLKQGNEGLPSVGYNAVAAPGIWGDVEARLKAMMGSGEAVDTSGIYDTQKAVGLRNLEETAQDMAEKFDVGGMRFSTPLQAGITRESERLSENLAAQQAQAQISAQENAMARVMSSMGLGTGLGSAQGGFGLSNAGNEMQAGMFNAGNQMSNIGNQLGAVGQLTNLGSNYAQLPLTVANSMAGLGSSYQDQQQASLNSEQNNPWMQLALQLSGQSPYGIPQTYQPSTLTNLLGGLSGALPYLQQLLGQKGTTGTFDPNALVQDYLRKQANGSWNNDYYGDAGWE